MKSGPQVSFLSAELGKWDMLAEQPQPRPEALMLPFFSDERPLRGAAGLCDFRLCGRLSRLLRQGKVAGAWGEVTLYPPGRRLPFSRLVLIGLGEGAGFDETRAHRAAHKIVEIAAGLRLHRYALALPGRSTGRLSSRRALEIYLEAVAAAARRAELAAPPRVAPPPEPPESMPADLSPGEAAPIDASQVARMPIELVVVESLAGQKEAAELARR